MKTVDDFFGSLPYVTAWAPGRINLLGEHTDYNDGYMLPIATPQGITVRMARRALPGVECYSATLNSTVVFDQQTRPPAGFGRYIEGCIRLLQGRGMHIPDLLVHVDSNLPLGAGMSSSAALEVATLRALRLLLGLPLDDLKIALVAQQAEIEYAGVNCGVMDQMACSLADSRRMLFLDARTLETSLLALPPGCELVAIDSGVARTLAASKYNERRAECERAAAALGVAALRDVADPATLAALAEPLRRRARHVVSENARVLEASLGVPAPRFGALMRASHASLRDDYEVSVDALDELCALLEADPDVYGARLTGAGFGGACIALCRSGTGRRVGDAVVAAFNARGGHARLLLPAP
jgi:galactokinase